MILYPSQTQQQQLASMNPSRARKATLDMFALPDHNYSQSQSQSHAQSQADAQLSAQQQQHCQIPLAAALAYQLQQQQQQSAPTPLRNQQQRNQQYAPQFAQQFQGMYVPAPGAHMQTHPGAMGMPQSNFSASVRLVTYTTMEPCVLLVSFLLSQLIFAMLTSFSLPKASTISGKRCPSWSRTAVRLVLSTFTGNSWSRRTRHSEGRALCALSLTHISSFSSQHAILMRFAFLASLMTAAHRQWAWSSRVRISVSIACLTNPTFGESRPRRYDR